MDNPTSNPRFLGWVKEKLHLGEAELVDEWLARQKGQDKQCFTHSVTVYFPMTHPEAKKAYELLLQGTTKAFGGATVWEGEGTWCPDKECKMVDREPVRVIHAAHHCTKDAEREIFAKALKEAEMITGQTMVGVKGTNKFYLLPPKALKP